MRVFKIRTSSYFPQHLALYKDLQCLLNQVTSEELWHNQSISFAFGFLLFEISFLTYSVLKEDACPGECQWTDELATQTSDF